MRFNAVNLGTISNMYLGFTYATSREFYYKTILIGTTYFQQLISSMLYPVMDYISLSFPVNHGK